MSSKHDGLMTAAVSRPFLGFGFLSAAINAAIVAHLLPAHALLGFAGASLCVICTYFWWTLIARRSNSLSNVGHVFKLFSALFACEVAVAIARRVSSSSTDGVWGYLTVALLLIPCLRGLDSLTLVPGLQLLATVCVCRLLFLRCHLPSSTLVRACLALALGLVTTTATWLIVKRREMDMRRPTVCLGDMEVMATQEKSSVKKRRFSSFVGGQRGRSAVHSVDMTTVIEAHGLLLAALENAPFELHERLRNIANLLSTQAPAMDPGAQPIRPLVVTSMANFKTGDEEEDEEDFDDCASSSSSVVYHRLHRKSTFTTVTDSMGLPKCDAQPTELRSRTNSLHLRRSRSRGTSVETLKISGSEVSSSPTTERRLSRLSYLVPGAAMNVDACEQPLQSGFRNRSHSIDYSVLSMGRQLDSITEVDNGSAERQRQRQRRPSLPEERPVSADPEETTVGETRVDIDPEEEEEMVPSEAAGKLLNNCSDWDFDVFELAAIAEDRVLSRLAHHLFSVSGLTDMFQLPSREFLSYFSSLESGYHKCNPYHNRIHAADVLHGAFFFMTSGVPGFALCVPRTPTGDSDHDSGVSTNTLQSALSNESLNRSRSNTPDPESNSSPLFVAFPPLEVMALYMAAAMHDYDHPGRTNAFLVQTSHHLAVLYNDHSVLENHHVASAWRLLISDDRFNFLSHLEVAEFKRLRYLVVQLVLATDLKKHFDILAAFNAKMEATEGCCIDWSVEQDRLLVLQMIIKMADINSPTKKRDLQIRWTQAIAEELYRQGDEQKSRDIPVEMFMDRADPQLAKLQVGFIRNIVAPLFNGYAAAGLLPGRLDSITDDTEPVVGQQIISDSKANRGAKFVSPIVINLQSNFNYWEGRMQLEQMEERRKQAKAIFQLAALKAEQWQQRYELQRRDGPPLTDCGEVPCPGDETASQSVSGAPYGVPVDGQEGRVAVPVDTERSDEFLDVNIEDMDGSAERTETFSS